MKAKQLIEELQKIIDESGDADIRISCMGESCAKFVNSNFDVLQVGHDCETSEIWLETTDVQKTKENVLFCAISRYSEERMNKLMLSLQFVEEGLNKEYIKLREQYLKDGDIVPPLKEMIGDKTDSVMIFADKELLDYIDNLLYIKSIYEKKFKGKVVNLKVGIELGDE